MIWLLGREKFINILMSCILLLLKQCNVRFWVFWDVSVLLGFIFSIVSKESSAFILKGYRVNLT